MRMDSKVHSFLFFIPYARLDKYLYEDAPFDICSCQLRDWNLGTVFIGLALVKSMLKRNSRNPDLLVSSTSFTWRMLLIAQNELFHSISSNYWQRRQIDAWRLLHIVANALQYGLELVLVKNFHEFVHEYLQKTEFTELMRMMGALGEGRQEQSNFTRNHVDWLHLNTVDFHPP